MQRKGRWKEKRVRFFGMREFGDRLTRSAHVDPDTLRECHFVIGRHTFPFFDWKLSSMDALLLQHISHRSLRFGKLGEFITRESIAEGLPSIGAPPVSLMSRQISYVLKELVEHKYLFRVTVYPLEVRCYGINLPFVLPRLLEVIRETGATPFKARREEFINRIVSLSERCNRLHPILSDLSSTAFQTQEECLAKLKDNIPKVIPVEQPRLVGALKAFRGSEHGIAEDGSIQAVYPARKFLKAWAEAMQDAGFPPIVTNTSKVLAMAKRWMQELADLDQTNEKIGEMIVQIMQGWRWIRSNSVTTKAGKKIAVHAIPDFEFFYTYRTELLSEIFRHTGELKFMDAKEAEKKPIRREEVFKVFSKDGKML